MRTSNKVLLTLAVCLCFIDPGLLHGGGQIPGDCNQDGRFDISDGICLLNFLFISIPSELPCGDKSIDDPANLDLIDANGDRKVDISDAIRVLGFLFGGQSAPTLCVPGATGICECINIVGCPEKCEVEAIEGAAIAVGPEVLVVEDVFVGSSVNASLIVSNIGTEDLSIMSITAAGDGLSIFPPGSFDIAVDGPDRTVTIGINPTVEGAISGSITIESNATNVSSVVVDVSGTAISPSGGQEPDIETAPTLEFGAVTEEDEVERELTVENLGDAPLVVSAVDTTDPAFTVINSAGFKIPFTLAPGEVQNVKVRFSPPFASGGTTLTAELLLESNDLNEDPRSVSLRGDAVEPQPFENSTVLDARVRFNPFDLITADTCGDVGGEVQFGPDSSATDEFVVTLTDQGKNSVSTPRLSASEGSGVAVFNGLDACGLLDGVITVTVTVFLDGTDPQPPVTGSVAVKNTSSLDPPVVDPLPQVTTLPTVLVTGTSVENTIVTIEGGAAPASMVLGAGETAFSIEVALRRNTENTLIVAAVDNDPANPPPHPIALAQPVKVVHLDPSEIAISEVSTRPLTEEEIETLVDNEVINLDDPANFNVSMFTIVLTVGSFPVSISDPGVPPETVNAFTVRVTQPVAVSTVPGTVSFGGGGGWESLPTGGGVGIPGVPSGSAPGCQVFVVTTPSGRTIPGVLIIDGRIKTLKEFFQVTVAIQNTSNDFTIKDIAANLGLPAGLTPVKSGIGTDVTSINTESTTETVEIGTIEPQGTGLGQFIVRGDDIGTHTINVDFSGFITGGGLPDAFPFNGSASTTVQVFGPPELDVLVRHPSDPDGPDVEFMEIYTLTIEITNRSPRPALYTSLELFIGGKAELVDEAGQPIPDSIALRNLGNIQPGQTAAQAFLVRSLQEGEIIACQAVASENINLTVDTGPDGTDCNVANTIPANFEFPPEDSPPTLMAISPLNGQRDIPITTSVLAILTPPSACLTADTYDDEVFTLIDPNDPSKGLQVASARLVTAGTFYLEELDPFGDPTRHIATELTVEPGVGGDTTIAVLRLGLPPRPGSPPDGSDNFPSQAFLRSNTTYRGTLVGGVDGVCNDDSGLPMENTFEWTFSTEQSCGLITSPSATLAEPADGSIDRPINTRIVLDFSNRMSGGSFVLDPAMPLDGTFAVFQDATEVNGDLVGGTPVPGTATLGNLFRTLTYQVAGTLPENTTIHVRVTDGLQDVCGNPLQTPPNGVKLFSFVTAPPDAQAPPAPEVNPIPEITQLEEIQVSGSAEPSSEVTIVGGAETTTTTAADDTGLFSVLVPLKLNSSNALQVSAIDPSGNESATATRDVTGDPLTVTNDTIPPLVDVINLEDGAVNVPVDSTVVVLFNEDIKSETVNDLNFSLEGSIVPGSLTVDSSKGFTFTPTSLLEFDKSYTVRMRPDGIRDAAGNGLDAEFVSTFRTAIEEGAPEVTLSPATLNLLTLEASSFTVNLVSPAGPGGQVVNLESGDATIADVEASITIPQNSSSGTADVNAGTQSGTANITVSAPGLIGSGGSVVVSSRGLTLTLEQAVIGTDLEVKATITLDEPAPAAVTVNLQSLNEAVATVSSPSVMIAQDESSAEVMVTGVDAGVTTIVAEAAGYSQAVAGITVTEDIISLPSSLNLPLGQTANLSVLIAPNPAPPGGVVVTLESEDPGVVEMLTPTVTLAEGEVVATAQIRAVAGGTTTVTASSPGFASASSEITVSGSFNIVETFVTISETFPGLITIELQSGGFPVTAPPGGVSVNLAATAPDCVAVQTPVVIPEGQTRTTAAVSYGGTAGLLCDATVTASAPGIASDSTTVRVNPSPGISMDNPGTHGVGLQSGGLRSTLGFRFHGGVTMRIESMDPTVAVVALDDATAGTTFVERFLDSGQSQVFYRIQGVSEGTTDIVVTAPGFATGTRQVTIVQSAVQISGLGTAFNSLGNNVLFNLQVGIPSGNGVSARGVAPGAPLDITVSSSDELVGQLADGVVTAKDVTIQIAPPRSSTINGTLAFDPIGDGDTTVSASAAGFISTPNASVDVTVTAPGISMSSNLGTVGAGLQRGTFNANLASGNHGGVTMRIASADENVALVSPNANTPGTAFFDTALPNGSTQVFFHVQGVGGATGTVDITASATAFTSVSRPLNVVQPTMDIQNLATTNTPLPGAADDTFHVRVGIPNAGNTAIQQTQVVRAGATALMAQIANSDSGVAQLKTTGETAQTITLQIPPGQSQTPTSVVNGGIAFDPLSDGATTVSVTIPGFLVIDPSSVDVNVVVPTLSFSGGLGRIGSGLQNGNFNVNLSTGNHGGVALTIESDDPAVALVAPNNSTAGSESIDVNVNHGFGSGRFWIQGVEGATGTATIMVTSSGFSSTSGDVEIVQPTLRVLFLNTPTLSFANPDDFQVSIGIPNVDGTQFQTELQLRAGASALTATVENSEAGFGQLEKTSEVDQTLTVQIAPQQARSPGSVAQGGVAFQALAAGTTTVSASIPGFLVVPQASVAVQVNTPGTSMSNLGTVGAGLQAGQFAATLGAPNHGGVTVRIESDKPTRALVSPNASTAGTAFIDVVVPGGSTQAAFFVQGLEPDANVTISATTPGFNSVNRPLVVVQSGLQIINLAASVGAGAGDDPFRIRLGVPNAAQTSLSAEQALRAGAPTLTVAVSNSNPAAAQLTTSSTTDQTVSVQIAPGASRSGSTVVAGGVAFDPLAAGSTTVSATSADFVDSSQVVTVNP